MQLSLFMAVTFGGCCCYLLDRHTKDREGGVGGEREEKWLCWRTTFLLLSTLLLYFPPV